MEMGRGSAAWGGACAAGSIKLELLGYGLVFSRVHLAADAPGIGVVGDKGH